MASEKPVGTPLHPEQFKTLHKNVQKDLEHLQSLGVSVDPLGALSIHGHKFPFNMGALTTHEEGWGPILMGNLPNETNTGTLIGVRPTHSGYHVRFEEQHGPIGRGKELPITDPDLIPQLREMVSRREPVTGKDAEEFTGYERGTVGKLNITQFMGGSVAHHGVYDTRAGRLTDTRAVDWDED